MKRVLLPAVLVVALAGCIGGTEATPELTPEATMTAPPSPPETPEATPEPTGTAAESTTPSASQTADGSFSPATNAEADALFVERDECQNLRDGYQLVYPDSWYTNTEFRDVAPCSWFSPTFFDVDDSTEVPDEIAITITWTPTDTGTHSEEAIRREFGMVGGQNAVRVEYESRYLYQIQLGPTPEEGPNIVAMTTRDMGGDYELNKALLDRMMLTIEFVGSVQ